MCKIKNIVASLVVAMTALSANAQENPTSACNLPVPECKKDGEFHQKTVKEPYFFIQGLFGGSTMFSNNNSPYEVVTAAYGLSGGAMFTPFVGARLNVTAYDAKNNLSSINKTYKFNYINTNLDVMVNLYDIITKCKNNRLLDAYVIAGFGINYAWNNKELQALRTVYGNKITENLNCYWGEDKARKSIFSHSIRLGMLFDFNIAKHWSIGLETDINNFSGNFDSQSNGAQWVWTTQLSATYKIGMKKGKNGKNGKKCKNDKCPNKK